jgi:hypothetical protein
MSTEHVAADASLLKPATEPTDSFANSAHPPIHHLNNALSPEEFELVFQANRAEAVVYRVIVENAGSNESPRELSSSILTLHRRQADGRRQVGVRFVAIDHAEPDWCRDEPVFGRSPDAASSNDVGDLAALAGATDGELRFEIEDDLERAGKMPFGQLLRLMEAARIGRPSTYAPTLKRLFEDSSAVVLDGTTRAVALTPNGAELAARLTARCEPLSSVSFAEQFDAKLTAMADGTSSPDAFLSWILTLTRPDDPLAAITAAKLWRTVDELSAEDLAKARTQPEGGLISHPMVCPPATPGQETPEVGH